MKMSKSTYLTLGLVFSGITAWAVYAEAKSRMAGNPPMFPKLAPLDPILMAGAGTSVFLLYKGLK